MWGWTYTQMTLKTLKLWKKNLETFLLLLEIMNCEFRVKQ